jgi:hypothetical protein
MKLRCSLVSVGFVTAVLSPSAALAADASALKRAEFPSIGISMMVPDAMFIRDGSCVPLSDGGFDTEFGTADVVRIEREGILYLYPSYTMIGKPRNPETSYFPLTSCARADLSSATIKQQTSLVGDFSHLGWKIHTGKADTLSDIFPIVRSEFGLGKSCSLVRFARRPGALLLTIGGSADESSDCFMPASLYINYSPKTHRFAYWERGSDVFCDANGSDCYDWKMATSLRFNASR